MAARVLGREMQKILNKSSLLKDRVLNILNENIRPLEKSAIGRILVSTFNFETVDDTLQILHQIAKGINEKITM